MSMQSKIVLVTGATNGIGLATARELAGMGARIFGVCRAAERCAWAESTIRSETNNQNVKYFCADLSSMADVRALAAEFCQHSDRLDVLVNNAGAFFARRETSADGFEMTFALNHLSYFLLTSLLLDLLTASGQPGDPARVVVVASEAQAGGTLDEDVLLGKTRYQGFQAYASSKLCNIVFTYELARRLHEQPVVANVLHPGFVATGFALNNFPGILRPFGAVYQALAKLFVRSPEQGADTAVWLASDPETAQHNGKYFKDRKPIRSQVASYDLDAARRLWELSERLTSVVQ
jgi:NAD(P)-dependent dehydrogenase (short-subunit alcohol dehydrogenase family)